MKGKKPKFKPRYGTCRECGLKTQASRGVFRKKNGGMRCPACGGICDPDRPLSISSTIQPGTVIGRWRKPESK